MPDPRVLYALLQPYTRKDGVVFWIRIGLAYKNPDGTIDAYCDAMLVGHRFRLRELAKDEAVGVTTAKVPS